MPINWILEHKPQQFGHIRYVIHMGLLCVSYRYSGLNNVEREIILV